MQQAAIALLGFDRVAKGVAEVEQGALALLGLIAGDDGRLVCATAGDGFADGGGVTSQQIIAAGIKPVEKPGIAERSEEHTSELQSLMRISYAVFCLKKKKKNKTRNDTHKLETRIHKNNNNHI